LRTRRTFKEAEGTPAYEIITKAGLEGWPELSTKEVAQLAAY
jgi:hypothetical protein